MPGSSAVAGCGAGLRIAPVSPQRSLWDAGWWILCCKSAASSLQGKLLYRWGVPVFSQGVLRIHGDGLEVEAELMPTGADAVLGQGVRSARSRAQATLQVIQAKPDLGTWF